MANAVITQVGNHSYQDTVLSQLTWEAESEFTYTFENFFHPFVAELIETLNKESLSGMLDADYHEGLATSFFDEFYTSLDSVDVKIEHFDKEIDVSVGGPYANYNWELLFHIPLTIAVHLSKNQRFVEAQKWFHYIFDPTATGRVWKFLAFGQPGEITHVDDLLVLLSKPDLTADERKVREHILEGYARLKREPFRPHAVARTRPVAYQYCVVMKYLDNLIAWGDSLFRQDTIESINEATQLYVLAANLLGARPQRIPRPGAGRAMTFAELEKQGLDEMGNALVDLEAQFPFNLDGPRSEGEEPDATGPLFGIGRTLYFCIPRNEKMLSYWDTVADRLFKIRNCMNIEGVVRQLALFDPPIDPGMLVKAVAAGIDIGSIISGLNQPIGPVRSLAMIQRALELCGEVRALGGALLSALEKEDGERMALLRQAHEIKIQQMAKEVRFLQWKQAQEATETLLRGRAVAFERNRFYLRLLGMTPDTSTTPDTFPLDRRELTEENFDETYSALVGQYEQAVPVQSYPNIGLSGQTSPASQSGASGQGKLNLTTNEDAELNTHLPTARDTRLAANAADTIAAVLAMIPDFDVDLHFWGMGVHSKVFGGVKLSAVSKIAAQILRTIATWEQDQAGMAARTASYERRVDDWMLQSNLAARDLIQIGRQLIGSLIAEQVARHEYLNIEKQIEQSQDVDEFLHDKFTNDELYAWMQGETSRLYYEYYRFAFDTARKAEQTMKHELQRPEVDDTDYIKFNYWDGGRKGLLSGEALFLDVKRMELAYHENNKREYELIKHVSLRQLNPMALLTLKATGACEVTQPEWLFDMDCPGHYLRRIKNVSVSIPSVIGPHTSVNCTLTLLKSSQRKSPLLMDGEYARQGSEDSRFVDYFGTVQSIVTSSGNNDSGMFEANLRDERFLPFEGAGAESAWKLQLPTSFRQFDYNSISDVIIHMRYTAREGGALLREKATAHLEELVEEANSSGLTILLSLKHDFPSEWHQFVTGDAGFSATVKREHFPYFTQGREITLDALKLHAIKSDVLESITPQGVELLDLTEKLNDEGAFSFSVAPDGDVLVRDEQANVFALIKYTVEPG